jgi:hypothetical protein
MGIYGKLHIIQIFGWVMKMMKKKKKMKKIKKWNRINDE